MSVSPPGVVLCAVTFSCGAIGIVAGLRSPNDRTGPVVAGGPLATADRFGKPRLRAPEIGPAAALATPVITRSPMRARLRPYAPQTAGAVGVGVISGLVTGWAVAVPIGIAAGAGLPVLFRRTAGTVAVTKIEAVAAWTEMLQSTLAASAGLSQAIVATAPRSPMPIRAETTRLAALLEAGAAPEDALLQFADGVADPSADRVVCALLLSFRSRGQRLGEVLTALAESTRQEVALRLRIETSRASVRSSVRTVLVFSVAFAAGLVLLARSYLAPFGTPTGQLVLLLVATLYASGLSAMVALARPPAPLRLLGRHVVRQ